jgi:KDO2-lipid IV(A) lauroyltransferase
MPYMRIEELKAACDFGNLERSALELSQKGGFIVASAHMGPWEVGGMCLSATGLTVNTVALRHSTEAITAFFNERRVLSGLRVLSMESAFPGLKSALDRGECVALLIDRAYGGAKRRYRFLEREAELPIGYLMLAVRCRVPVVIAAFVFSSDGGFESVVEGVHYPDPDLSEDEAIDRLQERCIEDLESLVKTYSDQWFHFSQIGSVER